MTYEEAVEAMKSGKRVKAQGFTSDEFFEMHNGVMVVKWATT